MKKKHYIFPVVSINYLDTAQLMKASQPSEEPTPPGAPARRTKVF